MQHWTERFLMDEKVGFGLMGIFSVTWDRGWVIEYDCTLINLTYQEQFLGPRKEN